jgi:hypothetical protein
MVPIVVAGMAPAADGDQLPKKFIAGVRVAEVMHLARRLLAAAFADAARALQDKASTFASYMVVTIEVDEVARDRLRSALARASKTDAVVKVFGERPRLVDRGVGVLAT